MKRRTVLTTVLILAATLLVLVPAVQARELSDGCGCCCDYRSPGYWKNHPDAWPVRGIIIGGLYYNKDDAIEKMNTPGRGDKTYTLFRALVAAKLNDRSCCPGCCVMSKADSWMEKYGPVGNNVRGNSDAWQTGDCCLPAGEWIYEMLEAYNKDGSCPY
jgi:hypothetical protein